ncbi:MAG TPA: OmpA family protein [Bryobacteraceae bacterium]|nr:OmpA family protein [Bryobacteraceae bacterium]
MRVVPRRVADPHRDRWMVSYMDVLTILLIFFVAATAQTFAPKTPAAPAASLAPTPVSSVERKLAALGLDVKREPRGLVISLPQAILFASGQDAVNANARPIVEQIASVLREIPNRVTLVGHADAVPIHNKRFKNNWELAAARGLRLLEILGGEGIDESRLSVASYSFYDPRDTNETPGGRASNRRVEVVILSELAQ